MKLPLIGQSETSAAAVDASQYAADQNDKIANRE
jgi:hypothetical protein